MKAQSEDTLLQTFEKLPKHHLDNSAKERMLSEMEKQIHSKSRTHFPRWIGSAVAGVAAVAIVAGSIYGVSNHKKPIQNHHTTTATTLPKAATPSYQKYVNQMTQTQKSKLHQLLTRDTQIADLWIYDGNTDPTLVTQMESDFKEFQTLFPQRMASIKAEPDSFYVQTDPSSLSPGVNGNVLTGDLAKIYLAYEAAIWNMGDPNSNLYNIKLAQLVKRPDVPGVFAQWNRLFFGGRIDVKSLTK